MGRNVLLFKDLIAKHGNGLIQQGYVSVFQYQNLVPRNIEGSKYLCEYNNSNLWFIYTRTNNYLLMDLKTQYFITGMKIRETSEVYKWDAHPPSYALEFSNDKNTFFPLFQESKSRRISDTNAETEYHFDTRGYFRYFRLRVTDLADGDTGHGQYISWLDFYVITSFCSVCNVTYSQIKFSIFLSFFLFLSRE